MRREPLRLKPQRAQRNMPVDDDGEEYARQVLHRQEWNAALFAGFGGPCEQQTSGDAVVRYDQLYNLKPIVDEVQCIYTVSCLKSSVKKK